MLRRNNVVVLMRNNIASLIGCPIDSGDHVYVTVLKFCIQRQSVTSIPIASDCSRQTQHFLDTKGLFKIPWS